MSLNSLQGNPEPDQSPDGNRHNARGSGRRRTFVAAGAFAVSSVRRVTGLPVFM